MKRAQMKRVSPHDIPGCCAAGSQVDTLQEKLMEAGGRMTSAKRTAAGDVGQIAITSCDCAVSSIHHIFIISLNTFSSSFTA